MPTSSGGWKYTCETMASRSACNCARGAIVDTSQPQQKAGVLCIDSSDFPQHPLPLHIPNGRQILVGIRIRHNGNQRGCPELAIDLLRVVGRFVILGFITVIVPVM